MGTERLVIHGAREHNLKNVTLELPRDELIVFTGLSGSGKSSLAFDTIYAEGQRRYVESLSSYARQFLGQMEKPDVDFIEGLSPAISIDQKSTSQEPALHRRHDHRGLRLPAGAVRAGGPPALSRTAGGPSAARRPSRSSTRSSNCPRAPGSRCWRRSSGAARASTRSCSQDLARKGFARARIDGEVRDLTETIRLPKTYKHTIEVVVDRLVAKPDIRRRVADSIETALELAEGIAADRRPDPRRRRGAPDLQPEARLHLLTASRSTSSPRATSRSTRRTEPVPTCDGLGTRLEVDPELVVPDPDLSIHEGALAPWASATLEYWNRVLESVGETHGIDLDTPLQAAPQGAAKEILLYGSDEKIHVQYRNRYGRQRAYHTTYEGVIPNVERRHQETESDAQRDKLEQYMREVPCRTCKGARLKPESLAVTVGGLNIAELTDLSIRDRVTFIDDAAS